MLRIALCDDNIPFLDYEKSLVERFLTVHSVDYECDVFLSGSELLNKADAIKRYDLFILDYDLEGLTGFDVALQIYKLFPDAKIAFATNYYDFTREGYKYNAIRYLVKQEKTFESELAECIEYVLKSEPLKTIVLELSDGNLKVAVDDIVYIGSDKHYIEYFVKDRDATFYIRRCSLDDAIEELPDCFVRVHQRFIVNLKNAVQIKRYEIIVKKSVNDTKTIPISRNRYDDVNKRFCLTKGGIG